ncbi:RnfABCDGE type electron transport complex subunit G [Merdimonas faecis]|uniref:Ion-translocating oxidoreductase complex subunit G n=1 Tax=Merdimonas faecis TaxID=1653435 RepID=A0A9D3AJY9_9FIRM|nr:RnfABCDGE type electron transport complex subunit G [Merdimonas faecis]HJH50283.1 RnfABCDGE type electron transport complex subunit G [Merdimonas faecis]
MNKIIKNTLILTVITLVAGLLLGAAYEITKEPIAQSEENAKREAWQAVFPDADADAFESVDVDTDIANQVIKDLGISGSIDEVGTVDGGETGYVITTTDGEGYGGDIQVTVGITADGTVSGVSFLSISETAGLGMKATEASFYEQYVGVQTDQFYVSKDGGEGEPIDALSGATITTRAVTGAVNAALAYFQNAF